MSFPRIPQSDTIHRSLESARRRALAQERQERRLAEGNSSGRRGAQNAPTSHGNAPGSILSAPMAAAWASLVQPDPTARADRQHTRGLSRPMRATRLLRSRKNVARRRIEPIAIPIPARLLVPSRRRLRHRERPRRPWLCRQQLDRRLLGRRRRRDPEQLGERRGISAAKLQLPREAWLLQEERLQDLCDPLDRRALCRDRLDRRWLWRSWRLRLIDAPSSSPQFGNAVGGACHGVVIPSVICRRVAVSPLRCRSSGGSARPFEIECLTTPYDGCVL
jgi:hypothetical protein